MDLRILAMLVTVRTPQTVETNLARVRRRYDGVSVVAFVIISKHVLFFSDILGNKHEALRIKHHPKDCVVATNGRRDHCCSCSRSVRMATHNC